MKFKFLLFTFFMCGIYTYTFGQTNPNFYLHANGVTCMCPNAAVGETGTVNGVVYTKRTREQITPENASTTCTSGITDMSFMFNGNSTFNGDISSWDVSSVTNMENMFNYAVSFNQPIANWNVSKVTNMNYMFFNAKAFNQPLGNWNVRSVTKMNSMFYHAITFDYPINAWCVSDIILEPDNFSENTFPVESKPVWGTCKKIINPNFYLHKNGVTCICSNASVGEKGTVNGVTYVKRTREQITEKNVSTTCTSGIIDMSNFFKDKYAFNGNIISWDVSGVTDMSNMFNAATKFNRQLANWDVSSVTNMEAIFASAETFNQPIGDWNVSNVTNMKAMFNYAISFNQPIGSWNVSNVTNMDWMFSFVKPFNQPLNTWCVEKITSEPPVFSYNTSLTQTNKPIWGTCPTLSTDDFNELKNQVTIYPNPFVGNVKIITSNDVQLKQVQVINQLGQTVYTENTNELELGNLQAGLYYLRITTDKGILTEKLIKN